MVRGRWVPVIGGVVVARRGATVGRGSDVDGFDVIAVLGGRGRVGGGVVPVNWRLVMDWSVVGRLVEPILRRVNQTGGLGAVIAGVLVAV